MNDVRNDARRKAQLSTSQLANFTKILWVL